MLSPLGDGLFPKSFMILRAFGWMERKNSFSCERWKGNVEGEFWIQWWWLRMELFVLRGQVDRKQCAMIASAKYGFRAIFWMGHP